MLLWHLPLARPEEHLTNTCRRPAFAFVTVVFEDSNPTITHMKKFLKLNTRNSLPLKECVCIAFMDSVYSITNCIFLQVYQESQIYLKFNFH